MISTRPISVPSRRWRRRDVESARHRRESTPQVKLTAITPSRGTCIELGAAFVIIYGTGQGWPLSTTHCQIGATVVVGLFEGRKGVNAWLFAKCCFGWVITLVVVGTTTALLVGPSPEPLKGEYCDNYCQVNSREWMQ